MLQISDIILFSDIARLPKDLLREICSNVNESNDGTINELVSKIWPKMRENQDSRRRVYESAQDRIFGGKTSVSWFVFTEGISGVKETIIQNMESFNPFNELRVPSSEEILSEPILIGAAQGNTTQEFFLRYTYRTGVTREVYLDTLEVRPRTTTTTVYVNEQKGIIEVRTDPKNANKIAKSFAQLLNRQIVLEPVSVVAPFGNDAERLADALNGELIDTVSKPNLSLTEFTPVQAKSVVDILSALDTYCENEDINEFESNLQAARQALGDDFSAIPITALILNGLEKVGMGVKERDLRGTPFYDYFKSSVEHQGCFIQFNVNENGVSAMHTIRVGMQSNSIYFMSQATENAIDFVRERVII